MEPLCNRIHLKAMAITIHTEARVKGRYIGTAGRKGESRDQLLDRLMRGDTSPRALTEKEELVEVVASRVCTRRSIDDEGSSRSHDEGGLNNEGEDRVSKSCKIEQ